MNLSQCKTVRIDAKYNRNIYIEKANESVGGYRKPGVCVYVVGCMLWGGGGWLCHMTRCIPLHTGSKSDRLKMANRLEASARWYF